MKDFARWARRTVGPRVRGGIVLLYHRVCRLASDPQCLAVTPERFEEHLDVISALCAPVPLDELCRDPRVRAGGRPALAITFDDGYADVMENAVPRLVAAGVPATVFVTTGPMTSQTEFWWDTLERALLDVQVAPEWTLEWDADPTPSHRVYREWCGALRRAGPDARSRELSRLASSAGVPDAPRSTHRPMSIAEVAQLARLPGMGVGAHSATHPSLASRPRDEQEEEIRASSELLASVTGRAVTAFAYPFGGRMDVTSETIAAARRLGVTIGCTTETSVVGERTDRLRVPRLVVRNWTGAELERRLRDLGA